MSTTENYNFTTVPSVTNMTVYEFRQAVAGESSNFTLLDSILASIDIVKCSVAEVTNDAGEQVYRLVFTHRNGSVLTANIPAASSGSSGCVDLFVTCSVADQTLTHTYDQINEHIRNNGNVFLFDGSNIFLLDSESIRNNMGEMLSGWRFRRNYNTSSNIYTYFLTVWDNGSITSSSSVITPALAENLTTEINENSTDDQFPSAKAVHNKLSEKADDSKVVKTINGIVPDDTGNVQIEFSGGNGTGADGYSPSAAVEQTDTGAVITITDKQGTTTAAVNHGRDGANGTSVTVVSVVESAEDGGSNIVTFSDGKSVTVKNGSGGSNGITPHIGENEHWWIGDTDTGVSASGTGGSGDGSTTSVTFDGNTGEMTISGNGVSFDESAGNLTIGG